MGHWVNVVRMPTPLARTVGVTLILGGNAAAEPDDGTGMQTGLGSCKVLRE